MGVPKRPDAPEPLFNVFWPCFPAPSPSSFAAYMQQKHCNKKSVKQLIKRLFKKTSGNTIDITSKELIDRFVKVLCSPIDTPVLGSHVLTPEVH